jgi:hypothetical protein
MLSVKADRDAAFSTSNICRKFVARMAVEAALKVARGRARGGSGPLHRVAWARKLDDGGRTSGGGGKLRFGEGYTPSLLGSAFRFSWVIVGVG